MTFTEFISTASDGVISAVGGRIMQRRESDPDPGSWWVTFRRAAVLYRFRFDHGVSTLFFEREQGSFVANSASTWHLFDCRELPDTAFETALTIMDGLLMARWPPKQ